MAFLSEAEREAERRNSATHGSRFGLMRVIATDQHSGRFYRCPCGWKGWSVWGHALKHASTCQQAQGLA